MNFLAYLALFGWIPVIFLLFSVLPGRKALLISYLGGWLFLPVAGVPVSGLPDFTKASAISIGTLLAASLLDGGVVGRSRPRWFDAPVFLWCLCPLLSAVSAGLGVYAGAAAALDQVIRWGIPYFLGRAYFTDRPSLHELLRAICAAGMVYLPLCLFEIRMSPNLHHWVYGFSQHTFSQTLRLGGYRPQVFLAHGLALGLFMTTASLAAYGLWLVRDRRPVFRLSVGATALALVITTVFCKSLGALALLVLGLLILRATRKGRRLWLVSLLIALAPITMFSRVTGLAKTETILHSMSGVANEERIRSLEVRLRTEDALLVHARRRFALGWGPWGDYRVGAGGGNLVDATDGFWIIVLGKYGLLGLSAFVLSVLVAPLRALRALRRLRRIGGVDISVLTLCVLGAVYLLDAVLNAMPNPLYMIIAGALASGGSAAPLPGRRSPASAARPRLPSLGPR